MFVLVVWLLLCGFCFDFLIALDFDLGGLLIGFGVVVCVGYLGVL